ncbi:MAG: CBS domain-containing protein [Phenylobacterium sp.]|nr:CBS domain-containing protein [Phenylobacterium sp.]
MLVSQILRTKGDSVFTVKPTDTVGEVAELLHSRRVGALVVLDAERVAGIVSERDVVRAVATGGVAALQKPVADFMTTNVLYAEPGETVDTSLSRMTDRRIRHLPVCQKERLVGIVSIGDLVKWKISEVEAEADGLKAYIAAT